MGSFMRRNKSALFDQCVQFCLRNCKYRLISHAKMDLFAGVARKVAIPFFVLTAIGWLLVVIGFGLGAESGVLNRSSSASYPFWVVSFGGPIVIIAAVIQAAFQRPYSIFAGAITTFLSVLFITGLGMILYVNGVIIATNTFGFVSINLSFAGALLATLFWTVVMVLQNFYDYSFRKEE